MRKTQLNFQNWQMKLKVIRQKLAGQKKAHSPLEPLDSQGSALSKCVPQHTLIYCWQSAISRS